MADAPSALAGPGSVDPSFGTEGLSHTELGPSFQEIFFTAITLQPDGGLLATRTFWLKPETTRRYEPDGRVDPTFPPQMVTEPQLEVVEEDGKILKRASEDRLERLNVDLTPDTSFGEKGKSEALPFSVEEIVPLPSGKILVAGQELYRAFGPGVAKNTYEVSVARFESDGKLDPSFGKGGVVKLRTEDALVGEELKAVFPREGEGVEVVANSFIASLTAAGSLDPSFGTAGVVDLHGMVVGAHALPEGKVLIAGSEQESHFDLARYTADGQLDPSFGDGDGITTAEFAGKDFAKSVLWETDGSVLIGGSVFPSLLDCPHFERCETPTLTRFLPNGRPDPSFGTGGLLMLNSLEGLRINIEIGGVDALAARPAGGVFVGGGSGSAAFLAALGPDGELDPSFGDSGIVTEQEPVPSEERAEAIATDGEGRILVTGYTDSGYDACCNTAAVFRYLPDGTLDRSFGHGSGFLFGIPPGEPEAIATEPKGSSFVLSRGYPTRITRITESGELDLSYGEDGTVSIRASLKSIAALPGGGLIAGGQILGQRIAVVRLLPNGSLNPHFGKHGMAVLRFGDGGCGVIRLAVEPDGRILLAGVAHAEGPFGHPGQTMMLMRLLPNGKPDPSFGRGGRVSPPFGKTSAASAVATRGSKIFVAGWKQRSRRTDFILLSYNQAGQLDRRFAKGGIARTPVRSADEEPIDVLPTANRIIVVSDGPGRPVHTYRLNGRLDPSFGEGSEIAPTRLSPPQGPPGPLGALQGNNLILGWTGTLTSGLRQRDTIYLQRLLTSG